MDGGYRLAVDIAYGKAKAITRGGDCWSHRLPSIIAACEKLAIVAAILDGGAVMLDDKRASDFGALERALGGEVGSAMRKPRS